MSHSVMVPLTAFLQATPPVESVPGCTEDGAGADFHPGDTAPAPADPAAAKAPPPRDGPPDPLQRLVEALSGISSAVAGKPQDASLPEAGVLSLAGDGSIDPPDPAAAQPEATGAPLLDARAEGWPDLVAAQAGHPRPAEPDGSGRAMPDLRHGSSAAQSAQSPAAAPGAAEIGPPGPAPASGPPVGLAPAPSQEAPVSATASDTTRFDAAVPDAGAVPTDRLAAPALVEGKALADPVPARPGPVPVARQIAEAVVLSRGDVIEIALAPEELGRLRLVVSGQDQAPHVTVWVERPEVLEQVRRNGAFLQECLSDAGMDGASFEFRGDTPPDSRGDRAEPPPDRHDGTATGFMPLAVPVSWTPMAVSARLDIRI